LGREPAGKILRSFPGRRKKEGLSGEEGTIGIGGRKANRVLLAKKQGNPKKKTPSHRQTHDIANPLGLGHTHCFLYHHLHQLQHPLKLWHPYA
jgi:hypothetical protein